MVKVPYQSPKNDSEEFGHSVKKFEGKKNLGPSTRSNLNNYCVGTACVGTGGSSFSKKKK